MRAKRFVITSLCALAFIGLMCPKAYSQVEYIINGDFEGGMLPPALSDPLPGGAGMDTMLDDVPLGGWTIHETYMGGGTESAQVSTTAFNGPSAPGATAMNFFRGSDSGSGDWTTIELPLNINMASWSSITLSMDVYMEAYTAHNLEAGGTWPRPSWEWPAVVEVEFLAKPPWDTTPHTWGGVLPGGNPWTWRFGWYLDPPFGPGDMGSGQVTDFGDRPLIQNANDVAIIPNAWHTSTFNLLNELPSGSTITRIRIGGSGWDYGSIIDNVSIIGVPEPGIVTLLAIGGLALLRRRRHS